MTNEPVERSPSSSERSWLLPALGLAVLGLVGLIWTGSRVWTEAEQNFLSSFYDVELAGPGTYEARLGPGTYQVVVSGMDPDDVSVTSGDGAASVVFGQLEDLTLSSSSGNSTIRITVDGGRVGALRVDSTSDVALSLDGAGVVLTSVFGDAPNARRTGGSRFNASLGLGDAISSQIVPLLVSLVALFGGGAATFIAWRKAKRARLTEAREARMAARKSGRSQQ